MTEGHESMKGLLFCGLLCHPCSHSALAARNSVPSGDTLSRKTEKRECWNIQKTAQHHEYYRAEKAKTVY